MTRDQKKISELVEAKAMEQYLALGTMVVTMIRDLGIAGRDAVYGRRKVTYPGGEVYLFVVNDSKLADLFDQAADRKYADEG